MPFSTLSAFSPERLAKTVIAKANQQPLSLTPVILASVSAALAATLIRMILGLLVRPWSRAQKVWQTISIVALLLSFGSPMQGLAGHSALTIVILWVMHVVSAVSIYLALCWLTRPDWKFGTDWSPSVSYGGHLAVVTGATSGIGRAVAQQLHDLGFQVIGIGRTAKFPSAEFESSDRYHLVTPWVGCNQHTAGGAKADRKAPRRVLRSTNAPAQRGSSGHCTTTARRVSPRVRVRLSRRNLQAPPFHIQRHEPRAVVQVCA